MSNSIELDSKDRRILAIVQKDCLLPAEDIAQDVGLSASAVQRRLRRMRDIGLIVENVAVLDAKRMGYRMQFVLALEIERERKELVLQLRRWLDGEEAVQQVMYVTGQCDLIAIILTPDMEAFDALTQRLVQENPNITRITTSVVIQTYKKGLYVPTGA